MQGPGDELLARARLAEDQDVEGGRGEVAELLVELTHDRAAAAQLTEAILGEDLDLDAGDLGESKVAAAAGGELVAGLELDGRDLAPGEAQAVGAAEVADVNARGGQAQLAVQRADRALVDVEVGEHAAAELHDRGRALEGLAAQRAVEDLQG